MVNLLPTQHTDTEIALIERIFITTTVTFGMKLAIRPRRLEVLFL